MAAVFSRVRYVFRTYPLTRGMASYAVIWPIGSLVQQSIQGKKEYDYGRVARFSFYGCCFVAPTLYTWIKIAGAMFPAATLRHALYKVFLENLTYGPFHNVSFYTLMTLLDGGTWEEAKDEVRQKFWPTWKTAVCFWPAAQVINFMYVPERNRVVYVSVLSFVWIVFLAFMKEQETKHSK